MILKEVELNWCKVDANNPDGGFDGTTPQWNVDCVTRDSAQAQEWKDKGIEPKMGEDDKGVFYRMKVKKLATNKNGSPADAPPVIGRDLMPISRPSAIGNGSVGNVKIRTFDYNFNGKIGVGVRLEAIQVTHLVEYEDAAEPNFGFAAMEVAKDTSSDSEDLF